MRVYCVCVCSWALYPLCLQDREDREIYRSLSSESMIPSDDWKTFVFSLCSSLTLTASPSGSYGLKLSGKAPAMVAQVQKGSPAARAGLQVGDFVLRVAGQETRSVDGEKVLRRLKEEVGKVVEVGVARPSLVPVTDKEKMRALIVLQTKVRVCQRKFCYC